MPSRVGGEGTGRGGGPRDKVKKSRPRQMRLFTAIELNEDTRQAIAAEQERIAGVLGRSAAASSLKWIRSEHMHLTLVFLGEIAETQTPAVIDAMGKDIDEAE